MFEAIETSWRELRRQFVFSRLFIEDSAVEGTCWFAQRREDGGLHIFANCLRITLILFFSPIYILTPRVVLLGLVNFFRTSWDIEVVSTPDAVLAAAPGGGGPGKYEVTHLRPRWMLEVTIVDGVWSYRQVAWDETINMKNYVALSYPYSSTEELFLETNPTLPPPSPDKHHRRVVAQMLLSVYLGKRAASRKNATEYIWLDEFCLSDHAASAPEAKKQRKKEVGLLADIFRQASEVCVFCHEFDCNHTGLKCPWGRRLFTLAEILHADRVLILTRTKNDDRIKYDLYPQSGRNFREQIQSQAALGKSWHLYAIMQHAGNSGAAAWQTTIHALLVEAIRRDLAGTEKYEDHTCLGTGLNGLLPRRARVEDLPGNDGWADLAWLLELNQGFYNAASLAAVCSLSEGNVQGQCWLGPPIVPSEGNERLEPLVTAFPVPLGLNIINPRILGLRNTLKRDSAGLHNNRAMVGLKWLAITLFIFLAVFGGGGLLRTSVTAALAWVYVMCILYCVVYLVAGSMYLVRSGWVLVYNVNNLSTWLSHRDSNFYFLTGWGQTQLAPVWKPPKRATARVALVDLNHRVVVDTFVLDSPGTPRANAIVPLAVHGSGLTCMILHRPYNPLETAHKVGIVNMPPYVLSQTLAAAGFRVGAEPAPKENSPSSTVARLGHEAKEL